jgi:hypothetical protein
MMNMTNAERWMAGVSMNSWSCGRQGSGLSIQHVATGGHLAFGIQHLAFGISPLAFGISHLAFSSIQHLAFGIQH